MSAGVKVSSGRLRVDAARAVGKLREYQLPDPTLWVLEVVRAAVAFGAQEIRVNGDANDVWVAWDGPTPDAESLTHLFDELVDPAPRAERRPVRLLATGVNTALGLEPRWIDVIVTDGTGEATSVRYTPSLFELRDGAAEGLRELQAETRRPSPQCPRAGGLVHLRRLPLLDAVPLMLGYGEPRELSVVRRSCDDSNVPIIVGGTVLGRERSHGDLLRVQLGEGLDGFIALVDPTFAGPAPELEVAELGVALARYTLTLSEFSIPRSRVPLRVHVNASRMPTNASRSAVRLDESPVSDAIERARELVPELISRLATELGETPEHPWSPMQRERLRAAALGLCAAVGAGSEWRQWLMNADALRPLLELELVRDALGRPRSLASFALVSGAELVHFGREPLDRYLEPWLGHSLWVPPGDPTSILFGDWEPNDAGWLVKRAHRYRRRRSAFGRGRKQKAVLEASAAHLLIVPIKAPGRSLKSCVPPELFEVSGLSGELALHDGLASSRGLTALLDGREIGRMRGERFDHVDGVATCKGLVPEIDYSGLTDNAALSGLHSAVCAATVVAYEALALRWRGRTSKGDRAHSVARRVTSEVPADRARIAAILRQGVFLAMDLHAERFDDVDPQSQRDAGRRALLGSKSPLRNAAIWPKVGGGFATTSELFEQGGAAPYVLGYYLGAVSGGPAPEGRAVFELSRSELSSLKLFLPSARFIDYSVALVRPLRTPEPGDLAHAVMLPLGAAIELEPRPGLRVAVTWPGDQSTITGRHWGVEFWTAKQTEIEPPCRVLIEDSALVPNQWFKGAEEVPEYPVSHWNQELARRFVDALTLGKKAKNLFLGPHNAIDARAAQTTLLRWIARADNALFVLGRPRFERLADVAFVRRLGRPGYCTLAELAAEIGDGPLEWVDLSEAAAVDLGDWHPICADAVTVAAFGKILDRKTRSGRARLERRRRAAGREHALARHRVRDVVDPASMWTGPRVVVTGKGMRVAWAMFGKAETGTDVQLLIESRPFREFRVEDALPMQIVLDLPPSAADADFAEVSEVGHRRVLYVIGAGARRLLESVAENSPTSLTSAPDVRRLLLAWSARIADKGGNAADRRTLERLAAARAFPTVQGEHVSLDEAADGAGLVRLALWDEPWLGADGGRELVLDRPVLRLPTQEEAAYRAMLRALFANRTQDVSNKVARLQAKRRVERGLMRAPRLVGDYDARFRFELSEVLDEREHGDWLGVLGIGEVALVRARGSKVSYERGGRLEGVELALIPAVHVAAQVPGGVAGRSPSAALRKRLASACEVLISLLIRRAVDETPPDQLPLWLREQLRDSALAGGELHLSRLQHTPIFETTTGTYVSPKVVQEQAARFGEVWTTELRQQLRPLDPARIALRLTSKQAEQISPYAKAVDATVELQLDHEARRNQARPPVTTLEPSAVAAGAALAVVALVPEEGALGHGSIVLLKPGYEFLGGTDVSRSFQPLGEVKVRGIWPVACRIDDPGLTPDRTWAEPLNDAVLARLTGRIKSRVYAAVADLTPLPVGKLAASRVISLNDQLLPNEASIMGTIWLEEQYGAGVMSMSGPGSERTRASVDYAGRPLPISGSLWLTTLIGDVPFQKLCVELYMRLLVQLTRVIGGRRGARRESAFVYLTTALRSGVPLSDEDLDRVALEGFSEGGLQTLGALSRHLSRHELVAVCSSEQLADAQASRLEVPIFVHDGSQTAARLMELCDARARPWTHFLPRAEPIAPPRPAPKPAAVGARDPVRKPAPPKPRHALAEAVLAAWRALPLPGVEDVRLDGRRKNPPIVWNGPSILLSKRNAVVRRAVEAIETGELDAESHVALLVAHAAGVRRRSAGNPSIAAERTMLTELMIGLTPE